MKRLSNNPPPNPPRKHHFIPAFYLSRWAGADGQLCQFAKGGDKVLPYRRSPTATGFAEYLYQLDGLPPEIAQSVETQFFQPVDDLAARALTLLETDGNRAVWTQELRSAWSRFLHSLLVRAPEDLEVFKKSWRDLMLADRTGEWQEFYEQQRQPHHPATYNEYMAQFPDESHNRSAMVSLMGMIDNERIGLKMNQMLWHVIDTDPDDHPLMTSDRAVIRTNGLMSANGHLALPIGPRKLFIAAKDQPALDLILSANVRGLVRESNRQCVAYAVQHVYAVDDGHIDFVRKHFATKHQPRLMESIAERGEEMQKNTLAHYKASHP